MNREEAKELYFDFRMEVPKDHYLVVFESGYELNLFHEYLKETRGLNFTIQECTDILEQYYSDVSGQCDREGFYE